MKKKRSPYLIPILIQSDNLSIQSQSNITLFLSKLDFVFPMTEFFKAENAIEF